MDQVLKTTLAALLYTLLLAHSGPLIAQDAPDPQDGDNAEVVDPAEEEKPPEIETHTSAREVLEGQKKTEELLRERETSDPDSIERGSTPLAAALAMSAAFKQQDYERAGQFLDMRYLPEEMDGMDPEALVRALSFVVSQQIILDLSRLSDSPEGNTADGLPDYRDLLATVALSRGDVPIYLQRVPDGEGGRTWKISNATVRHIPEMWQELGFHPVARYLFDVLPDFTFLGMLNWQVLGVLLSIVVAWLAATVFTWIANRLVQLIPNIFPNGIERFFHRPFRFFVFLMLVVGLVDELGLSLKLRVILSSSGLDYIAWTILLLGIISLARDYNVRKLQAQDQHNYAALLRPITTMLKVVVVIIVGLVWADNAGYNMSTVLAGLGVGSVAVALAAQKTFENLIGAITLYSARPVAPGDFCRFGTVTGTVEEIGLRSTSIRTLDRTLVHIPNSVFSSTEIENYSVRDRIRYFRNARVLAASPDQLRVILADIRRTLYSHPMVYPDSVSVRLDDIGDAAARLRLDAGVRTTDFQEFLAVAEDLNLRFIGIITEAGASLAGPGALRMVRDEHTADAGDNPHVRDMLALWREEDSEPFPNFSSEEIAGMRDSIDYGRSG